MATQMAGNEETIRDSVELIGLLSHSKKSPIQLRIGLDIRYGF